MNAFYYVEEFADRKYPSQSFEWIDFHKEKIARIARDSGISAGAIAGIMAEERKDYLDAETVNELSDLRARLRLTPTEQEVVNNMVAGPNEALLAYLSSLGNRPKMTHEDWVAELAEVEAKFPDPDAKPGILDKLQHPSLIDVGYGNFRICAAPFAC